VVSDRWFESTYGEEGYNMVVVKVEDLEEIDAVKTAIEGCPEPAHRRGDRARHRAILQTILDASTTSPPSRRRLAASP